MIKFEKTFALNKNIKVIKENFQDSIIYYVDNFYKNPGDVVHYMKQNPPLMWKDWETPTNNGKYFIDSRHFIVREDLKEVYDYVGSLCNGTPLHLEKHGYCFLTNMIRLYFHSFNDYQNNYWWPHKDEPKTPPFGWTAIVYFDDYDGIGTNLYEPQEEDVNPYPEHYQPWRPKKRWNLIKEITAKFNRLVLFESGKYYHGAAINDVNFFHTTRMNQVLFFKCLT